MATGDKQVTLVSSDDPTNKLETPREAPGPRWAGRFREFKMVDDGRTVFVEWQDGFRVVLSAAWLRLHVERWVKRR